MGDVNTAEHFCSLPKSAGSMSWRPCGHKLAACDFHTLTWNQPWDASMVLYFFFVILRCQRFNSIYKICFFIEFNNYPSISDLFSLLHFCRQLYMFRVLTPIIRSWYSCKYSFWYWLTGSTTIRSRCCVGTQQRKRMVVDPVNQQLYLQLCELLMMGVNTRNM